MERGQFVQDLLLSTLLMDRVDLSGDFLQSLEEGCPVSDGERACECVLVSRRERVVVRARVVVRE